VGFERAISLLWGYGTVGYAKKTAENVFKYQHKLQSSQDSRPKTFPKHFFIKVYIKWQLI